MDVTLYQEVNSYKNNEKEDKPFLHLERQGREGSCPGYQYLSLVSQEALEMCCSCLE